MNYAENDEILRSNFATRSIHIAPFEIILKMSRMTDEFRSLPNPKRRRIQRLRGRFQISQKQKILIEFSGIFS